MRVFNSKRLRGQRAFVSAPLATVAYTSFRGAKFELAKVRLKQQICRRRFIRLRLTLLEVAPKKTLCPHRYRLS